MDNKFNIPIYRSLHPYVNYIHCNNGFISNVNYNIKSDFIILKRVFNKPNKSYAIYGIQLIIDKTK